MILLDRYLFKQFSRNLLLVLAGLVTIYLLIDFFERIDDFIEARKSFGSGSKILSAQNPSDNRTD